MGRSLSAQLVYGYDLGGDGEWKVREVDEYGDIDSRNASSIAWYDEDSEDFVGDAERRLLAVVAGFTETRETADGYYAREREAKARLGVRFESYGLSDSTAVILAAHVVDVGWSGQVDLAELADHPDRAEWDAALASAIAALGITPTQEAPGWILCAHYG